jgi:hypothetical protein
MVLRKYLVGAIKKLSFDQKLSTNEYRNVKLMEFIDSLTSSFYVKAKAE